VRGAQIPYGSFLAFPAKNNVLLVGDAAGFADPVTGEGIYNAVLSGYIAADILGSGAHANKAKAYRNQCRARIIRSLRQAKLARWFLFEEPFHSLIIRKLHGNPKHMRLFMSVLAGEADYADYFCETVKGTLRPGRAVS